MAYVYEEQKLRRLLVTWPPPLASTFALPSDPNMRAKAHSVSPVILAPASESNLVLTGSCPAPLVRYWHIRNAFCFVFVL